MESHHSQTIAEQNSHHPQETDTSVIHKLAEEKSEHMGHFIRHKH